MIRANSARFLLLFLAAGLAAFCSSSNLPKQKARADVMAYVDRAARLVENEGEAACPKFSTPPWLGGEWYVFVNEVNGVMICHPVRKEMIGKNEIDLQDSEGTYMLRKMIETVNSSEGRGWVTYLWPRPGETTPARKSTYVIGVTAPSGKRYIVGSGAYDLE